MIDLIFNKPFKSKSFKLTKIHITLFLILLFTLANGFFNSINLAFGKKDILLTTFLFPHDLYGDLVKTSLSFFQQKITSYNLWDPLFQNYYLDNPYGGIDALRAGKLTNMHVTPLAIILFHFSGYIIIFKDPYLLVLFFYALVIGGIVLTAKFFSTSNKNAFILSIIIFFSYPILFTLQRGHFLAFIVGILLVYFFYSLVQKKHYLIPILLLVIAVNIRPNLAILSLLFIAYGARDGFKAFIVCVVLSLLLFFISLSIANLLYPSFSFINFIEALKIYSNIYVIGNAGDLFNNSLFGAFKMIFNIRQYSTNSNLHSLNLTVTCLGILFYLYAIYLYAKNKMTTFEICFISMCIVMLVSTVFAVYHLFSFFAFILIANKDSKYQYDSKNTNIILLLCVFLLSPKNYFLINSVSIESLLNPFVALFGIILIVYKNKFLKKFI